MSNQTSLKVMQYMTELVSWVEKRVPVDVRRLMQKVVSCELREEENRSDIGDTWRPRFSDPFNFLDELATCDLCRANSLLSICCYRGMFVWVVEGVS